MPSTMRRQALRADLLMLLTAFIWGTGFIAQTVGMEHIGPFMYSGLRFVLGAACLLPLLANRSQAVIPAPPLGELCKAGAILGVVLALGINFQQVGLLFTSVTNSGFITGLYVIVVPLLGIWLGQRSGPGTWSGALLAVVGMFLLCAGDNFQVASGDWLQLAGALAWGVHVLLVGHYAGRHSVIALAFIQFVVCAAISLTLSLLFESTQLDAIIAAGPSVLYGGVVAVGIGYTLQVVAQRHAIASHAAIIFSLEAVFAAIAGALWLGESLSTRGYLGCLLMLAGMLLAQLWQPQLKAPEKA